MKSSNMQEARKICDRASESSDVSLVSLITNALNSAEARGRLAENEACAKIAYYHKDIELFPKTQNQYETDRGQEAARFSITKEIRSRQRSSK